MQQPLRTTVVVVGGGIAGVWSAYRLIKRGVPTILIAYCGLDRGGLQGSTWRSAGAINTTTLKRPNFESYMEDLGVAQAHPFATKALKRYFESELEEFSTLFALKHLKIGVAPASQTGAQCMQVLQQQFVNLGGMMVDGWLTRIIASEHYCHGVQYEQQGNIGRILCHAIVLAAGGYGGLFPNSIRTNSYGNVLGRFLYSGGVSSNLEFLFKHGYGNIDTNELTPTEEIAGAEIYDSARRRVYDLERLLFDGQGTSTHLQAVNLWLNADGRNYTVDLSHRSLYLGYKALRACWAAKSEHIEDLLKFFPLSAHCQVKELLAQDREGADPFETYQALKLLSPVDTPKTFRPVPLTYFCMGGAAHVECCTNLKDVYATGEFMHDFGANRVGGLPWALYLATGQAVAEKITNSLARFERQPLVSFPVSKTDSAFTMAVINLIQDQFRQQRNFSGDQAADCVRRLRKARYEHESKGNDNPSDAACCLLVAEAVLQSSICRRESRGHFYRDDFRLQDDFLNGKFSCAWYDKQKDLVVASIVDASLYREERKGLNC